MSTSARAFREAKHYLVGGVNSPVRSFQTIGGAPPFIRRASGQYLFDIDGHKYLDFCLSWGVHILGHNHPAVIRAVKKAIEQGVSFGAPTELETKLAKTICTVMPSIEKIRFVNSGTEATMSALKLARYYTGRQKVIFINGGYHGHAEHPGIICVPFNDADALAKCFQQHKNKIAALIIEPVPANMGVVLPETNYLTLARQITKAHKALLIFDEVITGLRLGLSGAQGWFGVKPDLTCLGKIVGGGFPAAAYGGRADIMSLVAPSGPVYQAGTLSGNPVAMSAGLAVLSELQKPDFYPNLHKNTDYFYAELRKILPPDVQLNSIGSMFTLFFTPQRVRDYKTARTADLKKFAKVYRQLLKRGVYFSPAQLEANFISARHTKKDLDFLLNVLTDFS